MILIDGYLDITIYIHTYIYIYACLQIIPIISYKVTGYYQRILLRFWNAFTKFTVPLKGEYTHRCGIKIPWNPWVLTSWLSWMSIPQIAFKGRDP